MKKSYEKPAVAKREKLAVVTAVRKKPISYTIIKIPYNGIDID